MNSEREKICRQVASLFALTTSSVAGEAQAARDMIKRLCKTHTLTYAEVSPFGNELALKVMRSFWSIVDAPSPAAPAPVSPPPAPTYQQSPYPRPSYVFHGFGWDYARPVEPDVYAEDYVDEKVYAEDLRSIWEKLAQGMRLDPNHLGPDPSAGRPFSNPSGSNPYGRPFAWEHQDPRLYVDWNGVAMLPFELSEYALGTLINDYGARRITKKRLIAQAHDAIDAGDYERATNCLNNVRAQDSLTGKPNLTDLQYEALIAERTRRSQTGRR